MGIAEGVRLVVPDKPAEEGRGEDSEGDKSHGDRQHDGEAEH